MLQNINLENILFIDIETAPGVSSFEELDSYEQQLWLDKRGKYKNEGQSHEDYYFNSAAIYAEFGKIICISAGYFKDNTFDSFTVTTTTSNNEKELLQEFTMWMMKFQKKWGNSLQLCGHNIKEFDVPYICRRLLVNGMIDDFPYLLQKIRELKPWDSPLIDTMDLWRFGDFKNFISLKLLTYLLQIPSPKDDISGADVAKVYYIDNDIDRIKKYCSKDVVALAQILLKLKGKPLLREENVHFLLG